MVNNYRVGGRARRRTLLRRTVAMRSIKPRGVGKSLTALKLPATTHTETYVRISMPFALRQRRRASGLVAGKLSNEQFEAALEMVHQRFGRAMQELAK